MVKCAVVRLRALMAQQSARLITNRPIAKSLTFLHRNNGLRPRLESRTLSTGTTWPGPPETGRPGIGSRSASSALTGFFKAQRSWRKYSTSRQLLWLVYYTNYLREVNMYGSQDGIQNVQTTRWISQCFKKFGKYSTDSQLLICYSSCLPLATSVRSGSK
jgi:hypothetical protein